MTHHPDAVVSTMIEHSIYDMMLNVLSSAHTTRSSIRLKSIIIITLHHLVSIIEPDILFKNELNVVDVLINYHQALPNDIIFKCLEIGKVYFKVQCKQDRNCIEKYELKGFISTLETLEKHENEKISNIANLINEKYFSTSSDGSKGDEEEDHVIRATTVDLFSF